MTIWKHEVSLASDAYKRDLDLETDLQSLSDLLPIQPIAVVTIHGAEQVNDAEVLLGVVQDLHWVTIEYDVTSLSLTKKYIHVIKYNTMRNLVFSRKHDNVFTQSMDSDQKIKFHAQQDIYTCTRKQQRS